MKYNDEDIAFAHKILNQRDELDAQEVDAWLENREHAKLLNELAAAKRREEDGENDVSGDGERKSRQMTLRWSLVVAVIVIIMLIISQLMDMS